MADPTHLHVYECSLDHTFATATTRAPLKCVLCRRLMAYKWTQPIVTQAERDIAANGVMFNPFVERPAPRCRTCKTPMTGGARVTVAGVGAFCSAACTEVGVQKRQRYLQRLEAERAEQYRKEHPWLTS